MAATHSVCSPLSLGMSARVADENIRVGPYFRVPGRNVRRDAKGKKGARCRSDPPNPLFLQSLKPHRTSFRIALRHFKRSGHISSSSRRRSRDRSEGRVDKKRFDSLRSVRARIQRFIRSSICRRTLLLFPCVYPSHDALTIGIDIVA